MGRREDWDDDGDYVKGRPHERDYYGKYRHKIYDYDEDDDVIEEEDYFTDGRYYEDEEDEYER